MASIARTSLLRQAQFISTRRLIPSATPLRSSSSILSRTQFQPNAQSTTRFALFSTSAQKKILPAGQQVIEGGVNDPAPIPPASSVHGSYHWTAERFISLAIIPLTIAPFAGGTAVSPTLDALLVSTVIIHSHIGFQSSITDYIPGYRLPRAKKVFDWILNIATLLVCIGFYEYETNDVGLAEGIRRVWHAGKNDATIGKVDINALGHDGKLKHLKE